MESEREVKLMVLGGMPERSNGHASVESYHGNGSLGGSNPPASSLCEICGERLSWDHDHKADMSGLDDGPFLPGHTPRKKPQQKSVDELRQIRAKAWETRRAKYGPHGHR